MSDFIETLEQEETNLALHTKLCAQRYQQITVKFDAIDTRLEKIESTLVEIKSAITSESKDNYKMYLTWAGVIITTLIGATGYLLTHYVL